MKHENRYSHHARRALAHAALLVQEFHHPRADTGHLLLGIMRTQGSIGFQVLRSLGLDAAMAAPRLNILTLPLDAPPDVVRNDAALDMALELAADEAAWFSHHYIGTEHFLLGMTRTNLGNAGDLLRELNVSPDQVRRRVRRLLGEGMTEFNLESIRRNARYSELVRRVITAAEQISVSFDHETVGIGHLLAALINERRGNVSLMLTSSGVSSEHLMADLASAHPHLMESGEPALAHALELSAEQSSHYTGTEHLLMALLHMSVCEELLRTYGVNVTALQSAVQEQLSSKR